MCIEINKVIVSNEEIFSITNKYKNLLNEMDEVNRCIRTLIFDDNLIEKTWIHIQKTTFYWRDLKLPVTPSSRLSKDYIMNQMGSIVGGIADKIEYHIERSHQVGKRLERKCQCVTAFAQSQTSQIKAHDLLSNPIVEIKLEKVKEETLRKFNCKR